MTALKKKFSCRIEELPVLGGFVGNSFETNMGDFIEYSPDFKEPYFTVYKAKLKAVEEIVFPKKVIKEMKVVTSRLYQSMENLRDSLNKLQGYVERADGLSVTAKDFGIKAVRDGIAKKDVEKFLGGLAFLIQNIDDNFDKLAAKGFRQNAKEVFVNTKNNVKDDNELQNTKTNEVAVLVQNNISKLVELWDLMTDILKIGKILYKNTDTAKTKEFTMAVLKDRIRQEKRRSIVTGSHEEQKE